MKTGIVVSGILFIVLFQGSCSMPRDVFPDETPDISKTYPMAVNESVGGNRLTVTVDGRYEAYCVMRVLMGDTSLWVNEEATPDYPYYRNVLTYFAPFRGSDTIRRAAALLHSGYFPVDFPPMIVRYLENDLSFDASIEIEPAIYDWLGERGLLFFVELLQSFCRETDFNSFYEQNRAFYAGQLSAYADALSGFDIAGEIEGYFGASKSGYILVLEPLQVGGNFGIEIHDNDGEKHYSYLYFRPRKWVDSMPVFYDESAKNTLRHEFSHPFCNPWVESNWSSFSPYADLVTRLNGMLMASQGYGNPPGWGTMVYEHVVRAVTVRLSALESEFQGASDLSKEINQNGFIFLDALCNSLKAYEADRASYPDLDSYMPELAASLDAFR